MSHNSSAQPPPHLTPPKPTALTADIRGGMFAVDTSPDRPPEGDRWSSWDGAQHGPNPRPAWVITDLGAVDQDLGILKTGKEADVHVIGRWVPGGNNDEQEVDAEHTGRSKHADGVVYLAAKRFRDSDHRMFHRDAGYLEGRRVRRSRETRAMARRTDFGKQLISSQWAFAEFNALAELWSAGLPVPYPVQITDTELLMEFIGDQAGPVSAAPQLARARPEPVLLVDLFEQFRATISALARHGWAHGDLSPYNVLLHGDRLVFIDWPQIVDLIGNPRGPELLHRDSHNMCAWFASRGLIVDEEELFGDFMAEAMSRW